MKREYIVVKPSRESLNPDDIVSHISSLHKLINHTEKNRSIKSKLNPLEDSSEKIPEFEFLAISQGKDTPVQFFYGTNEEHLQTLQNRLTTAYPASFDVDIVEIDLLQKLIPPEKYAPEDFVKQLQDGHLQFNPDATGTPDDIEGDHTGTTTADEDNASSGPMDADSEDDLSIQISRPSENTREQTVEDVVTTSGEPATISPEEIDGYEMLEEIDAGLLDLVSLPDEVNASGLDTRVDGPTWTENGEILARPTLEHGTPVAVRWHGTGERKKDWMTTMKMFSKIAEPGADDVQDRAPLATLVQHLVATDLPVAYQIVFKRVEDWSRQAKRRKDNLHLNRDTLGQKVMYEVGEIINKPSKSRQKERLSNPLDEMGESASGESPIAGDVNERRTLIDNKIPKRTFRANARAVSVATDEINVADVERSMDRLASVLDHLDGYFYGIEPDILHDGEGFKNKKKATEEFHRLVNRELVTSSGKKRPDIIANADELANFITVPSSKNLTVEGVRGTRAEAKARDPLPKPDPDLMREFHRPGMRIGYSLDKEAEREPVPAQVPPPLLTKHFGRFATTGAGKSKALINDILSLHENSSGPVVLLDPKGDGMTQNYMRAHYERFGEEDFKENVIHYPVPDIMPGFTFFNIDPSLDQGQRRADAIQNKADHYQELLKLVMGRERYEESKVAPTIISALIKSLFDEYYVNEKLREAERGEADPNDILTERETPNKFQHRHLEKLTKDVRLYGAGQGGELPQASNEAVRETLEEQAKGDDKTFATIMNAVFNRLNYIREDTHLRRIFNNTEERFDFRDHLYDDKVILFDLGDLRDDATMIMAGLILTNLWDALKEADHTSCTQGHANFDECRERAKRNGLDPTDPPCREPWDDNHLVNIIIDEAASVAVSDIMNKMLEQGRSFQLSVGLSMQYPEQMKSSGGDRAYRNILNNVATLLIGKITLDDEIANAMAHEGTDVTEFSNRIKALPRGEWIAQLPSPNFMETGPDPFSLEPLPIPSGHPESKHVLTEEAEQRFDHLLENHVHKRTQEEFGIDYDEDAVYSSPNQELGVSTASLHTASADATESDASNIATTSGDTNSNGSTTAEEHDDTRIGDVNVPGISDDSIRSEGASGEAVTNGGKSVMSNGGSTTGSAPVTSAYTPVETVPDDIPAHVTWDSTVDMYECKLCEEMYYSGERENALTCCRDTIQSLRDQIGHPANAQSLQGEDGYVTSDETAFDLDGNRLHIYTVAREFEVDSGRISTGLQSQLAKTGKIETEHDLKELVSDGERTSYGPVISALVAVTPPEYRKRSTALIEWLVAAWSDEHGLDESKFTSEHIARLVYDLPPVNVTIDTETLLNRVFQEDIDERVLNRWESNQCAPAFKRYYSAREASPDTTFARTGSYGLAYNNQRGLDEPVDSMVTEPAVFGFPEEHEFEAGPKKFSGERADSELLEKHGVTGEDVGFLTAVGKAVNSELEGYDLTQSMVKNIRDEYNVDSKQLVEKGLLKEYDVGRYTYYGLTGDGMEISGVSKKHGEGVGDLGGETPHRVGVDLARRYYTGLDDVGYVQKYVGVDGDDIDFRVIGNEGETIAVGEVETPGTKNYDSFRKDAEKLAAADGDSVWVLQSRTAVGHVIRAFNASGDIDVPDEIVKRVENRKMVMEEFNRRFVSAFGFKGIDAVFTYNQLRGAIDGQEDQEGDE